MGYTPPRGVHREESIPRRPSQVSAQKPTFLNKKSPPDDKLKSRQNPAAATAWKIYSNSNARICSVFLASYAGNPLIRYHQTPGTVKTPQDSL